MDITGARWGLDGAESVLLLRAVVTNGDFDAYWAYHLTQEQHRNHHSKFADNANRLDQLTSRELHPSLNRSKP